MVFLAGLLSLFLFGSCRNVTPAGTYFDSEPPGAEVLIDGRRSGYVTPCLIGLDRGESYRVQLVLEGYGPREVVLRPNSTVHWISWDEGQMALNGGGGPFGLAARDILQPRRKNSAHAPNRIFLRLKPSNLD